MLDNSGNLQYDPGSYESKDEDDNDIDIPIRNQYQARHLIWENEVNTDNTVHNTMNSIAYVDLKFLNDSTFSFKGNLNICDSDRKTYNSTEIGDGKDVERGKRISYRYQNYTFQQQLRWAHDFNGHTIDVLWGHENYFYKYGLQDY